MTRITIELAEADLENVHVALGYAIGAVMHQRATFVSVGDRDFATRMAERLQALFVALRDHQ